MTKALRNMNSWWIRHAWGVLAASFVALTFFVSLMILDQISSTPSTSAQEHADYDRQKTRIDKLEDQVKNLGKHLNRKTSASTKAPTPTASPSSTHVMLYSPAAADTLSLIPKAGDNGDTANDTSGTSTTPGTSTQPSLEEPATPAPSATTGGISVGVRVAINPGLQDLMDSLSCGPDGASLCR